MKIKLKLAIILLFALMLSFSGCDFLGDDGGSSGGGGSDPVYYAIGDTGPSGVGIVFYITDGGLHGLEAAPGDQNGGSGIAWIYGGSTQTTLNNNTLTAIGTGSANTDAIIAQAVAAGNNNMLTYAAGIARSYGGGGKTDWFLPSKDELNELYSQKAVVGGFAYGNYWSSSEGNASLAWLQSFGTGNQNGSFKDYTSRVRAVRAF